MTNKIIIYKSKLGNYNVKVNLDKQTVWLTQEQLSQLFRIERSVITKHLLNIFRTKELLEKSNVQKMHIANSDKPVKLYNLDVIISLGYRVNSIQATQFRIWATKTLKKYLVTGIVANKNRLKELNKTISVISNYSKSALLSGHESEVIDLIKNYSDSLVLLKEYDNREINLPKLSTLKNQKTIDIIETREFINNLRKNKLITSNLFGNEYDHKLDGIIGAINQSFDNKDLYQSLEEKAANLLYLVIKDHPFTDGNKRIGSSLFIYFLNKNKFLYKNNGEIKLNDRGLVALALLVATSDPKDKPIMIKLIINLIKN
jgi:prophage maintenance system killer protein